MPKRDLKSERVEEPKEKQTKQTTYKDLIEEFNRGVCEEIDLEKWQENGTHKSDKRPASTSKKSKESARKHEPGTVDEFLNFLLHLQTIEEENGPIYHLKRARLVSKFSLIGCSETNLRFPVDLPEMFTFCLYNGGRYALWMDDTDNVNSNEILIVHVTNDVHLPKIHIIGDKFTHLLYDLADGNVSLFEKLMPNNSNLDSISHEIQEVIEKRKRKKLGNLPNDVGIWVPQEKINGTMIGYRDLTTSAAELKKILNTIGTHKSKAVRNTEMAKLVELSAYVNMGNDERDFGMGLEFGHWLWLANVPELDKMAERYLKLAYLLLKRQSHGEFLEEIIKSRKILREKTQKK